MNNGFFDRLKERKLVQWTLAYVAAAWVVLQVAGVLAQGFAWAMPVLRVLTIVLALGVPVVIVLAWYHGERGRQRATILEVLLLIAILAVGIAATAAFWKNERRAQHPAAAEPHAASIAVLPLDNFGGGPDDEALRGGITEEIISQLARIPSLTVISRQSATALKERGLTLRQIADTLGVKHVLEGSVQRAGGRVRVTVQLIEAHSDSHVWAQTYTREIADFFEIQEDIAAEVRTRIAALIDTSQVPATHARTSNEAYASYLRGMHWKQKRTREGLLAAMAEFRRVLQLDSSYAPAYAALAATYVHWAGWGHAGVQAYASLARAYVLADAAIKRDATVADGYAARGLAVLRATGDHVSARADLEQAIALRPNSAEFLNWHALALNYAHRYDEAITELQHAIQLNPVEPTYHGSLAGVALAARRMELALSESRLAEQLLHDAGMKNLDTQAVFAYALMLSGQTGNCLRLDLAESPAVAAVCLHELGRKAEATARVVAAERMLESSKQPRDYVLLANYYAWVGDANRAAALLRSSAELSPMALDPRHQNSPIRDRIKAEAAYVREMENIAGIIRNRFAAALRTERQRPPFQDREQLP